MKLFSDEELEGLCGSSIFQAIPKEKYCHIFECLKANKAVFEGGSILYGPGSSKKYAGILLNGSMEECLYDEEGGQVTLIRLQKGDVFGAECSCSAELFNQVYLRALTRCCIMTLDFSVLLSEKTMTCPYRLQVTANLLQEFSRQVTFLTTRIHILSQKRLRDKLKLYLGSLERTEDGYVHIPFSRSALSEFLYADRSAVSRELCRMRDEGLIELYGNRVRIIEKNPFASRIVAMATDRPEK